MAIGLNGGWFLPEPGRTNGRLPRQDGTVSERPIRLFGDPVLRTPCDAVDKFDEALASLVADLGETVSLPGRAGLAANQIGVSLRVFAYNVDGQIGHLVNPVIEAIEGEQEDDEGCLSIPGLWYPLLRAQYARARGVDRLGQPAVIEGEGLLARCIQHEIDHLNGRLFVDCLSGSIRKQAMRDLRERYIS
jgi:peptide deformylase